MVLLSFGLKVVFKIKLRASYQDFLMFRPINAYTYFRMFNLVMKQIYFAFNFPLSKPTQEYFCQVPEFITKIE